MSTPGVQLPDDFDSSDVQVSDLDSDLELDDLIPTYLKIKAKLYELDPQLVESTSRKPTRGAKAKKSVLLPKQTPTTRKLLAQLQQLRSDALFDEYEAEARWPAKRNEIAQIQATKRLHSEPRSASPDAEKNTIAIAPKADADPKAAVASGTGSDGEALGSDEDVLLGDMFSTVSDAPAAQPAPSDTINSRDIILRDFGKVSGLTPRKVLEEAVRSRYAVVCL